MTIWSILWWRLNRLVFLFCLLLCMLIMSGGARAADLPAKAPASNNGCGWFYGINMMGGAADVQGAPQGTVQLGGYVGGEVGYGCATTSIPYFVEVEVDAANNNAGNGPFALSAPTMIKLVAGIPTPLASIINSWLGFSQSNVQNPETWLPAGWTLGGSATSYAALTTTFNDVSAQNGLAAFHEMVWTPIGGRMGFLWNGTGPAGIKFVADSFAEVDAQSNNVCFGAGVSCARTGIAVLGGIEFKVPVAAH
jgi:hypothetical protein